MSNEQTDWNFNFDLRDVKSPTTKPAIAPEGYYVGKITKTFIDTSYNKDRVVFLVRVSDGPAAGAFCRDTMMLPGTTQRDNRRYWRGLFESMGFEARQINAQALKVDNASTIFVDKSVTFYWKPGDKELGTWNRMLFMNKADWASEKAAFDSQKASATPQATPVTAAPTTVPTGIPTPTADTTVAPAPKAGFLNNNMSSNDILAMLNNPTT